ncbi:GATA zinc finger domain-containing protein [Mycena venus]|uniref:GATA zinc finger domain-containing protein n=1 Tax=Mycena venus TaxID=2733690 RepID=A0A8H7CED5_9AGAR|nr:GATA zinc finger domain-containing protein [Mycena venus]
MPATPHLLLNRYGLQNQFITSDAWKAAPTSTEQSMEYPYSDRAPEIPPSLAGLLSNDPRPVHSNRHTSLDATIDFSGLIPMYPDSASPTTSASDHIVDSISTHGPYTSSPAPAFSLWDDSLVDSPKTVPYYQNVPDTPSSAFRMAYRRQPGGSNPQDLAPPKKSCVHCHVTSTPLWRRDPSTQETLCNACGLYLQQRRRPRPQQLIDADIDDDETLRIPDSEYTGPKCSHCLTRQTSVWRRSKTGAQVCNACGVYARLRGKDRPLSLKRNKIKPRTKHPR